jgi:hypothetical protein
MSDQAVVRVRDALGELQASPLYMTQSDSPSKDFPAFQRDVDALVQRCLHEPEPTRLELRERLELLALACRGKLAPFARYIVKALDAVRD